MSKSRNFFRNAFEAIMDARMREAERLVAHYQSTTELTGGAPRKR